MHAFDAFIESIRQQKETRKCVTICFTVAHLEINNFRPKSIKGKCDMSDANHMIAGGYFRKINSPGDIV